MLRSSSRPRPGSVYNADAVQRSLQDVTTDVARSGYAFAQVRPVGTRDPATSTINLGYVVEEGPRVYIERINVRGNTRTRDYVIRREFDLGEGDAYNQVLVDRAERRLNNLGYFKNVRISNEPGSAPDRVVVNVDVEDQSTGVVLGLGRLFDVRRLHRRGLGHANRTSSAVASSSGSPASYGQRSQRRRLLVHRAVLPRLPHGGRYRPVLEVQRPDQATRAMRTA